MKFKLFLLILVCLSLGYGFLTCPPDPIFGYEMEEKTAEVRIRNYDDIEREMRIELDCGEGVFVLNPNTTEMLGPDEEITYNFSIAGEIGVHTCEVVQYTYIGGDYLLLSNCSFTSSFRETPDGPDDFRWGALCGIPGFIALILLFVIKNK